MSSVSKIYLDLIFTYILPILYLHTYLTYNFQTDNTGIYDKPYLGKLQTF